MAKRNTTPAGVEGERVLITGKNIYPGQPRFLREINGLAYRLGVKGSGRATIVRECAQKMPMMRNYSMLDKDDSIAGKSLAGFTASLIGLDDITVGGKGRTSRHPGQEVTAKNGCF